MTLTTKQEFILEYMPKFMHKVEQELQEKLRAEALFFEYIEDANTIILMMLDRRRKR